MAEARQLYEESVALAPDVPQTLLGWARLEEADRLLRGGGPRARPRRGAVSRRRTLPAHPGRAARPRAALRGSARRAGAGSRPDATPRLAAHELLEKGRAAGPDGPPRRGLRRLRGRQAPGARGGGQRYLRGRSPASGRAAQGLLHGRPPVDPAARRRARRDAAADLHPGLPPLGDDARRADAVGASAHRRGRRAAAHRRHHRHSAAPVREPAELSRRARRAMDGGPCRRAGRAPGPLSAQGAPARRHAEAGRGPVHRQDAAQRDASRPDRAAVPRGAADPRHPPPARRRALGVLERPHPRVLLRLRAGDRGAALRARDGSGGALPARDDAALSAGPLRGHRRRPGGERPPDARLHRRGFRRGLPELPREPALRAYGELCPGHGTTLRPVALPLPPLFAASGAGHPRAAAGHRAAGLHRRCARHERAGAAARTPRTPSRSSLPLAQVLKLAQECGQAGRDEDAEALLRLPCAPRRAIPTSCT